jgi:hypothetical protein
MKRLFLWQVPPIPTAMAATVIIRAVATAATGVVRQGVAVPAKVGTEAGPLQATAAAAAAVVGEEVRTTKAILANEMAARANAIQGVNVTLMATAAPVAGQVHRSRWCV